MRRHVALRLISTSCLGVAIGISPVVLRAGDPPSGKAESAEQQAGDAAHQRKAGNRSSSAKPPAAEPATTGSPTAKPTATDISAGIALGETRAGLRMEQGLDENTQLDAVETRLSDVVASLSKLHHIPIVFDVKSMEEAGIATDTQVTAHMQGISLRSALKLVLGDLELTYLVRNEVLSITTEAKAETIMLTRIYPVRDIAEQQATDDSAGGATDLLIEIIRSIVAPSTWTDVGGPGAIKFIPPGSLVVSQTYVVHEEIRELLRGIRQSGRSPWSEAAEKTAKDRLRVVVYRVPTTNQRINVRATRSSSNAPLKISVDKSFLQQPLNFPQQPSKLEVSVSPETGPSKAHDTGGDEETVVISALGLPDELAGLIPRYIEPESWQAAGGTGEIDSFSGGIIVKHTSRIQQRVAKLLEPVTGPSFPVGISGSMIGSP